MRSPNRRHDIPLLNKYMSASTAQAVLRTSSLRWSSPLLFNDPFDVPREAGLPFTTQELRTAVVNRIKDYVAGRAEPATRSVFAIIGAISKAEPHRRELMTDLIDDSLHLLAIPFEIGMQQFRDAWLEKVRKLRILSLSAVPDSPTMWAHYSDNHRGVVLQFESSDERDSVFLLATPVTYQAAPPTLPLVDRWARAFLTEEEIDWNEYFHEYYYVKTEDWSYEKEYRAISSALDDSDLYYDSPFFREDLRGIILGAAMDGEDEETVCRLARNYPHVVISRARFDHGVRRVSHGPA